MKRLHYCRREGRAKPLFEHFSRAAIVKWLKANNLWREYKQNKIRIGYYL